jgi:hypothetical protein
MMTEIKSITHILCKELVRYVAMDQEVQLLDEVHAHGMVEYLNGCMMQSSPRLEEQESMFQSNKESKI